MLGDSFALSAATGVNGQCEEAAARAPRISVHIDVILIDFLYLSTGRGGVPLFLCSLV